MGSKELKAGRTFLVRADHDSDLIEFIMEWAKKQAVWVASFTAIGALKHAKLGFYDQQKHEYTEEELFEPQELASCIGNISTKEDQPFGHAHAVLADRNGNTKAGHLLAGKVFAAEIHITELTREPITKKGQRNSTISLGYSTNHMNKTISTRIQVICSTIFSTKM
jgi:uncharacterized protein